MITCQMRDEDLMEIKIEGALTKEEYDRALPQINRNLARHEKLKFLIILENFKGADLSVVWEDLKYDIKNRKRFGNVAVLGETDSERRLAKLSSFLLPSEVKFFKKGELLEAMRWLKSDGAFAQPDL